MFIVVILGSEYGLFERSSYGIAGNILPIFAAVPSMFFGYRLTKWRCRDKARVAKRLGSISETQNEQS